MELLYWLAIAVAGAALTFVASRRAVRYASALAAGLSVPPFIVGLTVVSVGTDIPEIANSFVAALAGHGDLIVGDTVGSVMTQITLVFGLLPFFASPLPIERAQTSTVGGLTAVALAIGALLVWDGYLSRLDAALLLLMGVAFTLLALKLVPRHSEPVLPMPSRRKVLNASLVLVFLVLVAVGAAAVVKALIEISTLVGVPEYLIAFFGASLGTSLPELAVDVTALTSGKRDLAIGDIVGSCLIDATISMGAGPLIAPVAISAAFAVKGAVIAIISMVIVLIAIGAMNRHNRWTGALCLVLYGSCYLAFIAQ